ncbi:MAG: hypothetical protein QOD42_807 [Sphingomonadales bacterium]|jgi:hypothetical protein|nr:hypothetical protein [Sphingomonadales bacterium]
MPEQPVPSLGVTNAYDGFGRLASSTLSMDGVSRPLSYQWDAGGRRTRVAHPDGITPPTLTIRWGG